MQKRSIHLIVCSTLLMADRLIANCRNENSLQLAHPAPCNLYPATCTLYPVSIILASATAVVAVKQREVCFTKFIAE